MMLDILIADDHSAVRHGLSLLTEQALGEPCRIDYAASGDEVLDQLQQKSYTLLLSDLMMPDQKGIDLIAQALEVQPSLRIVVISMGPERDFAAQCLRSGAHAYINKGASDAAFTKIIRSVVYESNEYHSYIRKTTGQGTPAGDTEQASIRLLSPREREVVLLLLQGHGVVEIAQALSISASAASTLKGRAFGKLNVQSVIELNRLAYYQGLNVDGTK